MSGRTVSKNDRAHAFGHERRGAGGCSRESEHSPERPIITAARREALMEMARDEPDKFVRFCALNRVVSLAQLPWWAEFRGRFPYEAGLLTLMAGEAGIGTR